MKEEQFNQLPSQGTIYSVGNLGSHLILGAGDSGKVFVHLGTTLMQQLPLQNLPYECDIISLDAYVDAFPVLAVAYVQKCANPGSTPGAMPDGRGKGFVTSHLNIYSTWISVDQDSPTSTSSTSSEGSRFRHGTFHHKEEFNSSQFDLLSQNCTTFQLSYIPYHLCHIPVLKDSGSFGNIILLSGSDRRIHAFEGDEEVRSFQEIPVKTYFPELHQRFPAVCTRLMIQPVNELTRRITMVGLETGNLLIWIVTSKLHRRRRMDSETTVTSGSVTPSRSVYGAGALEGFSSGESEPMSGSGGSPGAGSMGKDRDVKSSPEKERDSASREVEGPSVEADDDEELLAESDLDSLEESFETLEHHYEGFITSIKAYNDGFNLNILVSSALSPTYVYKNVIEERFRLGSPLKFSSRWDVVNAVLVEDIDRDGENEIIIGTFGCALLVYKYMDEILPEWVIVCKRVFPRPILAIEFVNPYLHVVTALGLHVIDYDTCAYFTNKPGSVSALMSEAEGEEG